jgi:hypothetical protein
MWLKEVHVVVLVLCGSHHFMQWEQKCHELHHGSSCVHCYGHNVRSGYPRVGMNPLPPNVIGRKACLRAKGLLRLSKDLGPKRHPNT